MRVPFFLGHPVYVILLLEQSSRSFAIILNKL